MTGHLVLSTLHTNDAASTPVRLMDMGVPPYMVAMSLNLVIAQRLVRMVCPDCSDVYSPNTQESAWLTHARPHGSHPARYAKGTGCSRCNGTGYSGRSAIYEMLEMTKTLVEAANNSSPNGIRASGTAPDRRSDAVATRARVGRRRTHDSRRSDAHLGAARRLTLREISPDARLQL